MNHIKDRVIAVWEWIRYLPERIMMFTIMCTLLIWISPWIGEDDQEE
jgi:hypothetical protein